MQTVDVDFGSLELESKVSALRLTLSSLAKFAPSAEDDFDTLRERLITHETLNARSIDRPWITRGNAFRLELSLHMRNTLHRSEQETLVEALTAGLRTTKVWRQLSLAATSLETSVSTGRVHLITVFLAHDGTGIEHSGRILHKLRHGMPFYDVKPPEGVHSAELDCVHLNIDVQRTGRHRRNQLKRQRRGSGSRQNPRRGSFSLLDDSSPDIILPLKPREVDSLDIVAASNSDGPPLVPDSYIEPENQEMITTDRCTRCEYDHENKSYPKHIARAPSLLKRSSSISDLETDESSISTAEVLDMVNAAIWMAISDCRRQLPKGISLIGSESFKHLDDLVPSLWSAGYLSEIASRAVFLPTISHALDSFCKRCSKLSKCKSTPSALVTDQVDALSNTQVEASSPMVPGTYSWSLWQTLQRRIYHASNAKRLNLPSTTANATVTDSRQQGSTFEIGQEVCGYDSLIEDDHVFLLEDHLFSKADRGGDEDLFHGDRSEYLHCLPYRNDASQRILGAQTVTIADIEDIGSCQVRACEDDLLSICESLSSMSLSEDGFESLEGYNSDDAGFGGHEMLHI